MDGLDPHRSGEQRDSEPRRDWRAHFDHFDPTYAADPVAVWSDLRQTCPIAHSEHLRGMWVPVRHADIEAVARDTTTFSSRSPLIAQFGSMADYGMVVPPISSDPPYHTRFRQLLLPFFSVARLEARRNLIAAHADELIDVFVGAGRCDASVDYARHIPVRVITSMLGLDDADGDLFLRWVHDFVEEGPTHAELAVSSYIEIRTYMDDQVARRRTDPGDDLISFLLSADLDGRPLSDDEIFGGAVLLLVAGIDTTWSSIGAALWHLAGHHSDQQRLRADRSLLPTAVEEFLRAYSPVTMAREVLHDTEFGGCPMRAGDPVLLPFPAANRDPEAFDDPDAVHLDRQPNRHLAFGVGIHRCLGSHLARLEITVALDRWLDRVPEFSLADPAAVTWSAGQVRGPRQLPVSF